MMLMMIKLDELVRSDVHKNNRSIDRNNYNLSV